jgi:hypothetical protein
MIAVAHSLRILTLSVNSLFMTALYTHISHQGAMAVCTLCAAATSLTSSPQSATFVSGCVHHANRVYLYMLLYALCATETVAG